MWGFVHSTKENTTKDDIVVEMKTDAKTEEAVLLKGVNGDKKGPSDQVTRTLRGLRPRQMIRLVYKPPPVS